MAIARALVRNPGLPLADEPTTALDRNSGKEVMRLVSAMSYEHGLAVLIVTHDSRILSVADRVLGIEDGKLSQRGAAT